MDDDDGPVRTAVDRVDDIVPDPVTETAEHPTEDVPPPWAEKLIDKVEAVADAVSGHVETAHAPEPPTADDTPVRLPWTHRSPFRKRA